MLETFEVVSYSAKWLASLWMWGDSEANVWSEWLIVREKQPPPHSSEKTSHIATDHENYQWKPTQARLTDPGLSGSLCWARHRRDSNYSKRLPPTTACQWWFKFQMQRIRNRRWRRSIPSVRTEDNLSSYLQLLHISKYVWSVRPLSRNKNDAPIVIRPYCTY